MTSLDLLALSPAVVAFALGALMVAANPWRRSNRAASFVFLVIALWSAARALAMQNDPLWFRATMSIGGLLPVSVGVLAAALTETSARAMWRQCRWLVATSGPLLVLPWLDSFTPYHPVDGRIVDGPSYFAYMACGLAVYLVLGWRLSREMRRVSGMALLELRVVSLTVVAVATLILLKMALQPVLPSAVRHYSSPFIMLAALGGMTWMFFTRRIFDAHYLLRLVLRYAILVVALTATGWGINYLAEDRIPDWLLFVVIAMVILALGHSLRARLDRWLFHFPAAAKARAVLHTAARQTTTEDDFRREFQNIVAGWARSDGANLLALDDVAPADAPPEIAMAFATLRRAGWTTPERLDRERPSPGRMALRHWLSAQRLGAVVVGRGGSGTVAVGVGLRATREPFTYPDIEQLGEFVEIAESAMERLRLTRQIVQSEKLATVGLLGASLAHEIRNPLYAIRAFVELLPANYDRTEFREQFTGLVGSEVVRIDHLISQLMNLASPRPVEAVPTSLHSVIAHGCELLQPKARSCDTTIETDLRAERDEVVADAGALKQVLLNLGLNAIHAQEHTTTRRWLRIATRDGEHGVELVVSDGGPGIAPAIRPRLFEPFQTNRAGGLGLGLSVTREVLARFGAAIAVEDAGAGVGAVFRVTFPRSAGWHGVDGRKGAPPGARHKGDRRASA